MGRLTDPAARAISKPGLHGDGNTLYLQVSKTGGKSWIQRVMIYGRRREIGLGGFPTVPLAEARTLAMANRRAIRDGRNPLEEKRRAGAPSRTSPDMADCINRTCPWSGRPVQADSLTRGGDLVVGFCNTDCRDKFDAAIRHFEAAAEPARRDPSSGPAGHQI